MNGRTFKTLAEYDDLIRETIGARLARARDIIANGLPLDRRVCRCGLGATTIAPWRDGMPYWDLGYFNGPVCCCSFPQLHQFKTEHEAILAAARELERLTPP
jgi:hypothetical protein